MPIVYETQGAQTPLIIVNGAITTRKGGSQAGLAGLLAPHFTVYTYDRRGRGDSGDTQPYAVEREMEDIEALIEQAGGPVYLDVAATRRAAAWRCWPPARSAPRA